VRLDIVNLSGELTECDAIPLPATERSIKTRVLAVSRSRGAASKDSDNPIDIVFVAAEEVAGAFEDVPGMLASLKLVAIAARKLRQPTFNQLMAFCQAKITQHITIERTIGVEPKMVAERHATPDDLLRLSVGIEDPQDLIADLESALSV
jgi:hypothetical protein